MRPGIRGLEAEHDILPADAHFHKFVHHFALGVVDLEPDFSVFDIKVKYDGKDVLVALPADAQQLKTVILPIRSFNPPPVSFQCYFHLVVIKIASH